MAGWHHRVNEHEFEQALGIEQTPEEPGVLQSMGSPRVRHDSVTEQQQANSHNPQR